MAARPRPNGGNSEEGSGDGEVGHKDGGRDLRTLEHLDRDAPLMLAPTSCAAFHTSASLNDARASSYATVVATLATLRAQ